MHIPLWFQFLRSTKLDELPQLLNVVLGNMAFIGPRPCLETQRDLIVLRQRYGINEFLPGLTGIGQVRGLDMSDPVRLVRAELFMSKRRSFLFDCSVALATIGIGRLASRTKNDFKNKI